MGLGTKNRQRQTADICKQHLREKYRDQRGLVEEFILEFEGDRKNCDVTRWDRFTDIKDIKKEMLTRLEAHFETMKRAPIAGEWEKIGSVIWGCKAGERRGGWSRGSAYAIGG